MTTRPARERDLSRLAIDQDSRATRRPRGRQAVFVLLGGIVLLAGLALGFRLRRPAVEVVAASPASAAGGETLLNASGYVTARRRATVAAKVTARVDHIYAEEGLHVKAGQVLAELDCAQPKATLTSAIADRDATAAALSDLEVQSANADRELKRAQELRAVGVNSEQALDSARTAAESLRSKILLSKEQTRAAAARIDVAQQDVDNCTVRSPFDGVVVSKDAQPGEMVSPLSAGGGFTRTGMATVVDMSSIEIEVDVQEAYITRVKTGQSALATLDAYPDWQIPCMVRTVIPTADRQKATVRVRLTFDRLDPRILPDMGVKVSFLSDGTAMRERESAEGRALIPKAAVRTVDGESVVFVLVQQELVRRTVSLGPERGADVRVISGISPGDRVVVGGATDLREGQAVDVKK